MSSSSGMTKANQITLIRIVIVPFFVALVNGCRHQSSVSPLQYLPLVVFLFAALLDVLDGYLARKRKEITRLGTILDPLADKLLTISALFMLISQNTSSCFGKIPLWFVVIVVSRETILLTGTIILFILNSHVHVKPRIIGKAATFLLISLIVSVLAGISQNITNFLTIPTSFLIILSLVFYMTDGIKQITGLGKIEINSAKNNA